MEVNIKGILHVLKEAWQIFKENHPIQFASAFAYFSLFGLPSIFLILIYILDFFHSPAELFEELTNQLEGFVGAESADLMALITRKYQEQLEDNLINAVVYAVTVFLLATQLIVFFQDILNNLWQIKPNFKNFWQKQLYERGLTFLMVLITGLLFYASAVIERLLHEMAGNGEADIVSIITRFVSAIIVFLWYAVMYKILPLVKIEWEPVWVGALITTLLFYFGVWMLWEFAVQEESLNDLYDYVAPVVLISFWIFYNSLAFLFGASITKSYAEIRNKPIEPKSFSYRFKVVKEG